MMPEKNNFWHNETFVNLAPFPVWLFVWVRQFMHEEINLYLSFCWNILILCIHYEETLYILHEKVWWHKNAF